MITIANANALHIPLADQSVQCVVTSPPYWGLRDYGTAKWEGGRAECDHKDRIMHSTAGSTLRTDGRKNPDMQETDKTANQQMNYRDICPRCGARRIDAQIGLESTPAVYVAHIVAVMRECWRVLKDDGTCWINLGDSYTGSANSGGTGKRGDGGVPYRINGLQPKNGAGLKPKDLCGIPWRVAFALQDDGWYLRSDIIWSKPNPMPESVTDRPTKAHEYVFLLTKQARYYYDTEAIKEAQTYNGSRGWITSPNRGDETGRNDGGRKEWKDDGQRNRRSVWTVATQPYSGAHFATFPPALIEPMILAGTSARGECPHCSKAWVRVVEKGLTAHDGKTESAYAEGSTAHRMSLLRQAARERGEEYTNSKTTIDWRPQCSCPPHEPIPQTVLDPFAGSGTTGAVAVKHGRKAVLLDLNTKYIDLQFERNSKIQITMPM